MNKLDELTWKYFWQQKIKEIAKFIFIGMFCFLIPIMVFVVTYNIFPQGILDFSQGLVLNCEYVDIEYPFCSYDFTDYTLGDKLAMGFLLSIIYAVIIMILCVLFVLLKLWLISNWEEARDRANKEVKKR